MKLTQLITVCLLLNFVIACDKSSGPVSPNTTPAGGTAKIIGHTSPTAILEAPVAVSVIAKEFFLDASKSFGVEGAVKTYKVKNLNCENLLGFPAGEELSFDSIKLKVETSSAFVVGKCQFSLIVVDSIGNISAASDATINFVDKENPIAILNAPRTIAAGAKDFILDGSKSFDIGSSLQTYTFKNIDCSSLYKFPVGGELTLDGAKFMVEADPDFTAGTCHFSLTVKDSSGNTSSLSEVTVTF